MHYSFSQPVNIFVTSKSNYEEVSNAKSLQSLEELHTKEASPWCPGRPIRTHGLLPVPKFKWRLGTSFILI